MLAQVDSTGIIRFQNEDIQQCREYLYAAGFTCTHAGWQKAGWLASITYHAGKWCASAWKH